jgi:hypothetical protein
MNVIRALAENIKQRMRAFLLRSYGRLKDISWIL